MPNVCVTEGRGQAYCITFKSKKRALANARRIELRNIKRGKYFRILADVWLDGKRLSQGLIKAGHARVYKGGKRKG